MSSAAADRRDPADVAVLGIGSLGRAVTLALHASGRGVGAWNRTSERFNDLPDGVKRFSNACDAVAKSALVIVTLSSYDAAHSALAAALGASAFVGKTVLQLSTGTPDEAHAFAEAITAAGGRSLDGAVLAYPFMIGRADTVIVCSGDAEAWADNGDVVRALAGGSRFAGSDPRTANVLSRVMSPVLVVGHIAYLEALAAATKLGVVASEATAMALAYQRLLGVEIAESGQRFAEEHFDDSQASVSTHLYAIKQTIATLTDAGADGELIATAHELLKRVEDDQHGAEDISVLSALLSKR